MKNDRNHAVTVGAVAASICIVLAAIMGWYLSSQNIQYDKQADHYAAEFASHSDEEILKSCGVAAGLDLIKCLRDELKAERDTKRGEADLAAQQKVAKWSLGAVILSALSLLFTAGGIWLVYLNLHEARKVTAQSILANEHSVRSSAHAHRMAQLGYREARAANEIASETAERQLRAYVVLDDIKYTDVIGYREDSDLRIHVDWKNAGATPAKAMQWNVNYRVVEGDLPDDFDFPNSDDIHWGMIGPGQTTRDVSVLINGDEVATASFGTHNLYVWGWVEYSDVFLKSPRRRSEFCILVDVDQDTNRIRSYTTNSTAAHNGTDEDCLKKPMTTA